MDEVRVVLPCVRAAASRLARSEYVDGYRSYAKCTFPSWVFAIGWVFGLRCWKRGRYSAVEG